MQSCATACIGRITECMQAQVWQIWDVHWLKAFTKAKWPRLMAHGTYLLLQHSPGRPCLKINHTCSILNGTFYPFLFFPWCLISFGFKHTRHLIKWFIIPKVIVKKGKNLNNIPLDYQLINEESPCPTEELIWQMQLKYEAKKKEKITHGRDL